MMVLEIFVTAVKISGFGLYTVECCTPKGKCFWQFFQQWWYQDTFLISSRLLEYFNIRYSTIIFARMLSRNMDRIFAKSAFNPCNTFLTNYSLYLSSIRDFSSKVTHLSNNLGTDFHNRLFLGIHLVSKFG